MFIFITSKCSIIDESITKYSGLYLTILKHTPHFYKHRILMRISHLILPVELFSSIIKYRLFCAFQYEPIIFRDIISYRYRIQNILLCNMNYNINYNIICDFHPLLIKF